MLTPEDRQRIEEEEQYRTEVRARLKTKAASNTYEPPASKSSIKRWVAFLLAVFGVAIAFAVFEVKFAPPPLSESTTAPPTHIWSPRAGAPFSSNPQPQGVLPALGNAIQTRISVYSQNRAHPTCSGILGYGHVAQSFCDGITGTRTITMPNQ